VKKKILSALLVVILLFTSAGYAPTAEASKNEIIYAASALYTLELFKGTGINRDGTPVYDLDSLMTREQAIIMIVRLTGGEAEALAGSYSAPFGDVSSWAKPYVGYAYQNDIVLGLPDGTLGGKNTVTANQYLTFILRALGYSSNSDFAWNEATKFSDSLLLTSGEFIGGRPVTRGEAALIAYRALLQNTSGGGTLIDTLCESGAVRREAAMVTGLSEGITYSESKLNGTEIYRLCAPSVFNLVVYDENGFSIRSGSGFFITADGLAVTNWHVVKNASSAKIWTAGAAEDKYHTVEGIVGYDAANDLAIIRVKGTGFKPISLGDSDIIAAGDVVYAIGNPLQLVGSISQGLVAYPLRKVDKTDYIQTTAAISPGSSGGTLINEGGEVIGVTTAMFVDGQNLNLAIPINALKKIDYTGTPTWPKIVEEEQEIAMLASCAELTLAVGESRRMFILTSGDVGSGLYAYSEADTISAEWGTWSAEDNTIPLTITGIKPGETTVYLTFSNIDNLVETELPIFVTVIEPGENGSYKAVGSVPDFGKVFGIEPAKSAIQISSGGDRIYRYQYTVTPTLPWSIAVTQYMDTLTRFGYVQQKVEDGAFIFVNYPEGRLVKLCKVAINGTDYYEIIIGSLFG